MPEDHLLAHGDALGQAGVYFRPGKIIQAAKNLGIGIAAQFAGLQLLGSPPTARRIQIGSARSRARRVAVPACEGRANPGS